MRCRACLLLFLVAACGDESMQVTDRNQVDVLIENGRLFSGDPGAGFVDADVGISNDVIVFVGDAAARGVTGQITLDATGRIVTAGFIDPHTHSLDDLESADRNANLNYLFQGVTTVFNGNDGEGPVDIAATAANLEANGIGTNTALYIGHGSLRLHVMSGENRAPDAGEMRHMRQLISDAMEAGALGLSTGLFYAPGSFATTREIIELASEAAGHCGVYDSHIRDESSYTIGLVAAVREALEIGKAARVHVHIAHIKALGVDVWGESKAVTAMIDAARENGQRVTADQYPWGASGTHMRDALLPKRLLAGEPEAYFERLAEPAIVAGARDEIRDNLRRRGGPESILVVVADDSDFVGRTLAEISASRGADPIDMALEIIRTGATRIASFNMHEDDLKHLMSQEWVMTSSDGTDGHPRKYASFPEKYSRFVGTDSVMTTEEFLYRSSALTAETFGLSDRGRIAEGLAADIVVIDLQGFAPRADFANWNVLSTGVVHALVNGQIAIRDREYTGALAGRVLAKTAKDCS